MLFEFKKLTFTLNLIKSIFDVCKESAMKTVKAKIFVQVNCDVLNKTSA